MGDAATPLGRVGPAAEASATRAFGDSSSPSLAIPQVVELCSPHPPAADHVDVVDHRRMHVEAALDPDPGVRNAPHRKRFLQSSAAALDHHTLENLDAFALSLADLAVDADRVPDPEFRVVGAQELAVDFGDDRGHGARMENRGASRVDWVATQSGF